MELKKIDDVRFEVEKDVSKGMTTGIRLYSNDSMMERVKKDRTLQQAVNATSLPGIVGKVLLMPDMHEGYGFPIGGVIAFDTEEGVISPGAIGFDINCLHPDTKVYDENGAWHKISRLDRERVRLISLDKERNSQIKTIPVLFFQRDNYKSIIKVQTSLGKEILVTGDHPIMTKKGMTLAKNLKVGEYVVTRPFDGLEFREPMKKMLLSRDLLVETLDRLGVSDAGNAKIQILRLLGRLGLDEIDSQNRKLPSIIKLLGLLFGDGTIPEIKKGTKRTIFYGKKEDLEEVKKDVENLGFKCLIQHRKRHHKIRTPYKTYEFDYEEYSATVSSTGFSAILLALGAPFGDKVNKRHSVPKWLMTAELWQIRIFLAAYFGAELAAPLTHNKHKFIEPCFRMSKNEKLKDNAIEFLEDIKKMLSFLGVEASSPLSAEDYKYATKKGISISFRMRIFSNTENLKKFFGSVGYIYNLEKERMASLAFAYLSYLDSLRNERRVIKVKAIGMHLKGIRTARIVQELSTDHAGRSFIEHSIWGRENGAIAYGAIRFDEFVDMFEVGSGGFVYDQIIEIKEFDYDGRVYDITISDQNHNFIANGIVVSNCGVRLIKTNLTEKEVRPKLEKLMDRLFANVPSGVGSKLKIGLTQNDLKKVVEEGVSHMVAKGFGYKEDVERIEENGTVMGADIDKVSPMARKRGMEALGTLGAGNHFLEVQRIDKIFSEKIAKSYELHEGQIVIMVHTGSRGFGHQICSDYLQSLLDYQKKNEIKLVDPELSYAKIGTKEADNYLGAMNCAVNYAFTNRQIITNSIRKSFEETFEKNSDQLGMDLLYDVAHNIAKLEEHVFEGKRLNVYVHRKGATRAFAKGRDDIPKVYRSVGQPVIIPGSMGTASYVLCGRQGAMDETFGSTCHGSGRLMSRHQAIRDIPAQKTFTDLEKKKIVIRVRTRKLISEEAEWAYKDVDEVVKVVEKAGISDIVSRNVPIGVAKG